MKRSEMVDKMVIVHGLLSLSDLPPQEHMSKFLQVIEKALGMPSYAWEPEKTIEESINETWRPG
jgi:hypothetical protein